jgi:hypothetical protein
MTCRVTVLQNPPLRGSMVLLSRTRQRLRLAPRAPPSGLTTIEMVHRLHILHAVRGGGNKAVICMLEADTDSAGLACVTAPLQKKAPS